MLAVTCDVPALIAVKEGISPVPVAASPMVVLSFVQVYVMVPSVLVVVNVTVPVPVPLHTTWLPGWVTSTCGFTMTSTVTTVPVHAPIAGVMVYLTVAGAPEVFVSVCAIVLPLEFENPDAVPLISAAVQE